MRQILYTFIACCLIYSQCFAVSLIGSGIVASGGTLCIGAPDDQTNCDYSTVPDSSNNTSADKTWVYSWTTDQEITLSRVKVYFAGSISATADKVVVYNGTDLIATADITAATNSWVWSSDLVAESGKSLVVANAQTLRYGYSLDSAGTTHSQGRFSDAVTRNYQYQNSYLPDDSAWTDSGDYDFAAILEYDY